MSELRRAAERLCAAAAAADWTGPDLYDGLAARWPGFLTGGRRRRQALIQLHARVPVDLRPLSRRSHRPIAKALALFASADLTLARLGDDGHARTAARALDRISADAGAGEEAWGYPWDVQTRWSHYRAGEPNVIVTAFAHRALLEGAEALGAQSYRSRADAAAEWVQRELWVPAERAYAYHPGSRVVIHNASLFGACCAWSGRGGPDVESAVSGAVERTLAAQAADGSFPYGEGPGLEFVDSFHTAYVLECLWRLRSLDSSVAGAVTRGLTYYQERFFDAAGRARLWADRPYPEDGHSAGTAMSALAALREAGADRDLLNRVATRATTAMVRGDHAIHRRYRWGSTRVRYVRWADGHMALGLARAVLAADDQG